MPILRRIYDNFEEYFCVLLVLVMIACLSAQVLVRILLGSSLDWTEELSRICFTWAVYVGAVLVAKRDQHVRVTAQFSFFGPKTKLAIRVFIDLIWVICNFIFAWQSLGLIMEGLEYPEISPTMPFIVKAYIEMVIPAAFIFMSWRIVESYYSLWRKGRQDGLLSLVEYGKELH